MSRTLYWQVENKDGKAEVIVEIDGPTNYNTERSVTFQEFLEITAQNDGEDIGMCSSSCHYSEEYGDSLSEDAEAILVFLQGTDMIGLRENAAVQLAIKTNRELAVIALGEETVRHITKSIMKIQKPTDIKPFPVCWYASGTKKLNGEWL